MSFFFFYYKNLKNFDYIEFNFSPIIKMKLQAIFLIALTTLPFFAFADEKDVEFEKAKQFFSKEADKMEKWLGNWNEEWKDIFTEGPAYTGDGTTYGDPVTGG